MALNRRLTLLVALAAPACASQPPGQVTEAALAAAVKSGDIVQAAEIYSDEAVIHRDYQPAFCGAALPVYMTALASRRTINDFNARVTETFILGTDLLVFGKFTAAGTMADGKPFREEGRFARLWSPGPDGQMQVIAEAIGHTEHQDDPQAQYVAGLSDDCRFPAPPFVGGELAVINERMAAAVKAHQAAPQIAFYADDAIYMPFETPDVRGKKNLTEHFEAYVDAGRGATFDSVRVWNDGFRTYGDFVVEIPRFEVKWRAGEDSGTVTGGGLRLWRRAPAGTLLLLRQIGTHDYRP